MWRSTSGAAQTLKRIAIAGGVAITICHVEAAPLGMTWDPRQHHVWSAVRRDLRVSSKGGKPESLISIGRLEAFLREHNCFPEIRLCSSRLRAGGDIGQRPDCRAIAGLGSTENPHGRQ